MGGRRRLILLVALAIDNVGSGLFLPLALLYATGVVGVSIGTAGLVVSLATLAGFIVPPLAGRASHRYGPRAVVVTSQLVQAAGAVAYLLAEGVVGLAVAAVALGAGTQLFYCSVFVLVADVSPEAAKERPFALVGMVRGASFGAGALLSAVLLALADDGVLRAVVAVDAVSFVVAAGLLATLDLPREQAGEPTVPVGSLAVLRDRTYLSLLVVVGLLTLGLDVMLVGTPVYVVDVLHAQRWLPGALLATMTFASALLGVWVVDRLRGLRRTTSLQLGAVAFVCWAVVWLVAGWVPVAAAPGALFLGLVALIVGSKIFYPVSAALSEALPPRADRAAYMATYQYAFTSAQVVAPALVGLFAYASWLPWLAVAAANLLAMVLLSRLAGLIPAERDRVPVAA